MPSIFGLEVTSRDEIALRDRAEREMHQRAAQRAEEAWRKFKPTFGEPMHDVTATRGYIRPYPWGER